MVAVQIHTQKNNQRVNDEHRPFQLIQQLEQQTQRVILEQTNIDILIINQGCMGDSFHVQPDILCPVI